MKPLDVRSIEQLSIFAYSTAGHLMRIRYAASMKLRLTFIGILSLRIPHSDVPYGHHPLINNPQHKNALVWSCMTQGLR
jgi:hypothetical protein